MKRAGLLLRRDGEDKSDAIRRAESKHWYRPGLEVRGVGRHWVFLEVER